MEQDEIIIRQGIVHILDGELGCPVYSGQLLELTPDINDFFRQHIFKILSGDDMKKCYFDDEKEREIHTICYRTVTWSGPRRARLSLCGVR